MLPSELQFVKYTYTQNGKNITKSTSNTNTINISLTLDEEESLTIYVTAKATSAGVSNTSKEVINKVTLNLANGNNLNANELTVKVIGKNYNPDNKGGGNNGGNSGEESVKTTYKISGVAWIDSNKNGRRDDGEEIKPGINVYLLNSTNNNVISRTTTNDAGNYTFTGIEKGKYIVAFGYDTIGYDLTTYQADGVDSGINSDVISVTLNLDGTLKKYATTNTLDVSDNIYNVDLGLVLSPKFSLNLTKAVSLMQVSNAKGTKEYTFNKVSTGKVEIPANDLPGSVVAITYTFTIENTGAVAGYAKKIVDYIPNDLNFNANLNPEWYQDTDGNLYNVSLGNTLINPGEKIEFTLVLTKTMTSENTGVTNNSAEIYEASNDKGIKLSNATPGNKASNEEDFGMADVIITVKTGGMVTYIGIVLIVLAVFTIGAYGIKKKVIERV